MLVPVVVEVLEEESEIVVAVAPVLDPPELLDPHPVTSATPVKTAKA
jgi:hypothetical protein